MTFYNAYKEYIIHHLKVREYIPTSEKFDADALRGVVDKIDPDVYPLTAADEDAIINFIEASKSLHEMHNLMYAHIKKILPSCNMQGKSICEYFIGIINRNCHILFKEHNRNLKSVNTKSIPVMDLTEFRLEQDSPGLTPLPIRSSLEMATDFTGLVLNYLRYFLDYNFEQPNIPEDEFAGRLFAIDKLANIGLLFRYMYYHALFDEERLYIADEGRKYRVTYDDEEKERLIKAGEILFTNKHLSIYNKYSAETPNTKFFKWLRTYRIKSFQVHQRCLKLSFGQGRVTDLNNTLKEIDAALMAYYPFLDIHQKLPRLYDVTIEEVLLVYGTMRYISRHVMNNGRYDAGLYTRSDFDIIPCKILKTDWIDYIGKLITLSKKKIIQCVELFEADWGRANNIWETPLYPIDEYEIIPLYALSHTTIYFIIDRILDGGGIPLDSRGKMFEKYIYKQLSDTPFRYERKCLPARKYGIKGDEEEIDVLVKLKHVVLVGEAKCIQYPMEAINYHDSWSRLKEGAEQITRKANFVKRHPEYFQELGDYSDNEIIPFVVTNYPLYTGCNHNGVYITDVSSFLSYMKGEHIMTQREFGSMSGEVIPLKILYTNEDEFSGKFMQYLQHNPQKELFLKNIKMEDCVIYNEDNLEWVSRAAQYMNDSRFNIGNKVTTS